MRTHPVWVNNEILKENDLIELDKNETHHLNNVLRIQESQEVHCLNGKGYLAKGSLIKEGKKLSVKLQTVTLIEKSFEVHAIGPLPKGKRLQLILEKFQEIGVTSYTPLITEFTQKNSEKLHLEKSTARCIEAAKQSLNPWLIEIKPMMQFKNLSFNNSMFILDQQGQFSLDPLSEFKNITLLFGPEGGWSPNEFKAFEENDIYKLKCNPNVLRMETAAILGTAKCIDWYYANA